MDFHYRVLSIHTLFQQAEKRSAAAAGTKTMADRREPSPVGDKAPPVDGGVGAGARTHDAPEDGVRPRGGGGLRERGGAIP